MSTTQCAASPAITEPGPGVRASRLAEDAGRVLGRLPELGPIALRAANAEATLSVEAAFTAPGWCEGSPAMLGGGAELRLDPSQWGSVFALAEGTPGRRRQGLRFLSRSGDLLLAADLTPASDGAAFRRLLDGQPALATSGMGDGVSDGAQMEDGCWAGAVDPALVPELLETMADAAVPLRPVLPLPGLWLSATTLWGNPVRRDAGLALHGAGARLELAAAGLESAEVRRVPTGNGQAHAVDLRNPQGHRVLRLMGEAVPGRPEGGAWRTLVEALAPAAEVR